jgi:hypothetical protein
MRRIHLTLLALGFIVLLGALGFVYMQQTATFASEVSQVTSSIFAMQQATSTTSVATTTASTTPSVAATESKATVKAPAVPAVYHSSTGAVPKIAKFEPGAATVGTTITITGTGFSPTTNYITFGTSQGRHHQDGTADNVIATQGSKDGKTLTFVVPSSSASGLLCDANNQCIGVSAMRIVPGNYPVTVENKYGASEADTFTVIAQ